VFRIRDPYTPGRMVTVSSKVRVGAKGSRRQKSYCARTAMMKGNWKTAGTSRLPSKNEIQRRRWVCDYVAGERRL
tara:strand:- start:124 stop:348 length:225 start_codon:yes stop_codon:yes gene_type:complete